MTNVNLFIFPLRFQFINKRERKTCKIKFCGRHFEMVGHMTKLIICLMFSFESALI